MISVIIPTYNSEKTIESCLKSLLKQSFPRKNYEIIIVDDGSNDRTLRIVSKYKVRIFRQKHSGPAVARNMGVKHSKGNIILFTDADCVPDKNWIKRVTEPFKNEQIVGVAGAYKTLNKNKLMARFAGYEIEERHEGMKKLDSIDFVGTYNCAYRKSIFSKFGGFDKSFSEASGEDTELSFRISKAGYKIVFQSKAIVYHLHPDNLVSYLKQKIKRAYWKVLLHMKHTKKVLGDTYTPKTLFPQVLLTGLALIFMLLTFLDIRMILASLFLIFISLLLNVKFYMFVWKRDRLLALLSPFIFLLRNIFSSIAIAYGFFIFLLLKESDINVCRKKASS